MSLDDSQYQDFVFFSPGMDDKARTIYEVSTSTRFPTQLKSVGHMVNFITDFCYGSNLIARHIRIVSHGSPDHFWIGKDKIAVETMKKHRHAFTRLSDYLFPSVARLEIFACEVGQSHALLAAISRALKGIPVKAYKQKQKGSEPGGRGPAVVCRMSDCEG